MVTPLRQIVAVRVQRTALTLMFTVIASLTASCLPSLRLGGEVPGFSSPGPDAPPTASAQEARTPLRDPRETPLDEPRLVRVLEPLGREAARSEASAAARDPDDDSPSQVSVAKKVPDVVRAPEPLGWAAQLEQEEKVDPASVQPAAVVAEWAQAWQEQRPGSYLSFYSRDFVPPDSLSRSEWEALRRSRIVAPFSIRVSVSRIEVQQLDAEHRRIQFQQDYRSDRYSDSVIKILDVVWEDDTWKILSERVESTGS